MSKTDNFKTYLKKQGASKVGFADVKGIASEFVDLPNGISIILKIPKETLWLFFIMREYFLILDFLWKKSQMNFFRLQTLDF